MEVWLLEEIYESIIYSEILFHIPNSDIWLINMRKSKDSIENIQFTNKFWADVGHNTTLTRLGNF